MDAFFKRLPTTHDNIERARSIWQQADSDLDYTEAADYLFRLGGKPPWPRCLRYLQECWHAPAGIVLPTLIAKISDIEGRITGIQRTYLDDDGQLADVSPRRMLLGSCAGNSVQIGRPKTGELLIIGESLTAALRWHWQTGCAACSPLSAAGIGRLVLLDPARDILIAPTSDTGRKAAATTAERWRAEGRKVRIAGGE